jgi:hypothetical protein
MAPKHIAVPFVLRVSVASSALKKLGSATAAFTH